MFKDSNIIMKKVIIVVTISFENSLKLILNKAKMSSYQIIEGFEVNGEQKRIIRVGK